MKSRMLLCASVLAWLGRPAHAGVPGWCGGATFELSDYDFHDLGKDHEPRRMLEALAKASCSTSDVAQAHRAEIDSARAAWGKKYGMAEDDWAEVIASLAKGGDYRDADLSANTLATLSPVDQYKVIAQGFEQRAVDPLYFADVLDAQLTATGRLAFVTYCLEHHSIDRDDADVVKWAVCQDDIDKLDVAKVYSELHADPGVGSAKLPIRMSAAETADKLKDYAARKAALIKKDGEYGKLFDVAAKARAEWPKTIGTNTKLLELVKAMDSATVFHSRKQFDGCEAKTSEALANAVSAIPAKSFAGMHDNRDDPVESFAKKAENVLAASPTVTLAAIAFAECQPSTGLGNYVANLLNGVPTARGPRNYALAALMTTELHFDDTSKTGLEYPRLGQRPYPHGTLPMSDGGVVKSVTPGKDTLVVALEKTSERVEDCVKEHQGRAVRIRDSGTIEYEIVCDKTAIVTRDTSYAYDFHVNPAHQKWLKPGVVFSATSTGNDNKDVIAVWPSKTAKLPSMVLGGEVK